MNIKASKLIQINPVWEKEIKNVLEKLWKNREHIHLSDLKNLKRISNKNY